MSKAHKLRPARTDTDEVSQGGLASVHRYQAVAQAGVVAGAAIAGLQQNDVGVLQEDEMDKQQLRAQYKAATGKDAPATTTRQENPVVGVIDSSAEQQRALDDAASNNVAATHDMLDTRLGA